MIVERTRVVNLQEGPYNLVEISQLDPKLGFLLAQVGERIDREQAGAKGLTISQIKRMSIKFFGPGADGRVLQAVNKLSILKPEVVNREEMPHQYLKPGVLALFAFLYVQNAHPEIKLKSPGAPAKFFGKTLEVLEPSPLLLEVIQRPRERSGEKDARNQKEPQGKAGQYELILWKEKLETVLSTESNIARKMCNLAVLKTYGILIREEDFHSIVKIASLDGKARAKRRQETFVEKGLETLTMLEFIGFIGIVLEYTKQISRNRQREDRPLPNISEVEHIVENAFKKQMEV